MQFLDLCVYAFQQKINLKELEIKVNKKLRKYNRQSVLTNIIA